MLKAALRNNLKEMKTFTIRNVNTTSIQSIEDLKFLIKDRFSDDIKTIFDVGYIQGTNVIRIRSKEDLLETWAEIRKSKNTSLWCDGLIESSTSSKRKRKLVLEDEDEDEQPRKKRNTDEKVQEVVNDLKNKHGSKYSVMQLRIWAELLVSELYFSLEDPPHNNSMFEKVGTGGNRKISKADSPVARVVAEAASAISHALSGSKIGQPVAAAGHSPAKLIESRSKLYKQLSELQNLKSMGVLDDIEYLTEKETIMDLLHQLNLKTSL